MPKSVDSLGVMVLAAGRGTRMRSERAKVLHAVAGKPLVAWVLDAALALAPERIAIVVGHDAEAVRDVCERHLRRRDAGVAAAPVEISYPVQREQHGTGDAARVAVPAFSGFSGEIVILYGDVPRLTAATLARLVARHRETGATLSLLTVTVADPAGYGRIRRDAEGRVAAIVEDRDLAPAERAIREVNPGIYCTSATFLESALARLRNDNAQREYYLTDMVAIAVADGLPVATVAIDDADEVAGINSRAELAALEAQVRRARVARWMDAGVTFRDPATAYVDEDVTIGADTEVGPNVQLRGRTRIGRGCRLDGTALLSDAEIGDRVHLRLGTVLSECRVGDDAVIGPFAHLRPGTELAPEVHVGNFVETKKARVGRGTKANHLTYLGDVDVGEGTNIGAGTITCNYDGFTKHRTVIGSRVQIGSDTQLVAPVTVADDAYVGAGTTVTRDVAAGSLVVSRVPQREVAGWVRRRRAKAGQPAAPAPPATNAADGGTAGRPTTVGDRGAAAANAFAARVRLRVAAKATKKPPLTTTKKPGRKPAPLARKTAPKAAPRHARATGGRRGKR